MHENTEYPKLSFNPAQSEKKNIYALYKDTRTHYTCAHMYKGYGGMHI